MTAGIASRPRFLELEAPGGECSDRGSQTKSVLLREGLELSGKGKWESNVVAA